MKTQDANCWEWDGWLNQCLAYHKAPWWDYPNVWSIGAVMAMFLLFFIVGMVMAKVLH